MSYTQYWEWETSIADASRFAAWSRDVEHLRTYLATPGTLLPPEGPRVLLSIPIYGFWLLQIVDKSPEPEPSPPLIIRGPDGTGEPLFTPTQVAFNGDASADDSLESFLITVHDLEAPNLDGCQTNKGSYDLLVVCALVRLAHHFTTIRVFSDGGKAAVERGVKICQQVFGDAAFPRWGGEEDEEISPL